MVVCEMIVLENKHVFFTSVSAQFRLIGRPREREADTEEPGLNTLLFFDRALWFFYMPSAKH